MRIMQILSQACDCDINDISRTAKPSSSACMTFLTGICAHGSPTCLRDREACTGVHMTEMTARDHGQREG
jgi:hypothetical protein